MAAEAQSDFKRSQLFEPNFKVRGKENNQLINHHVWIIQVSDIFSTVSINWAQNALLYLTLFGSRVFSVKRSASAEIRDFPERSSKPKGFRLFGKYPSLSGILRRKNAFDSFETGLSKPSNLGANVEEPKKSIWESEGRFNQGISSDFKLRKVNE